MNFREELARRTEETEKVVLSFLPKEEGFQKTVLSAMNYSVRAGGKRLRPMLMGEAYRMFAGISPACAPEGVLQSFQAAIEFIHTYSLVHDDLPALDGDELRRGKPSTWKAFGETMGILAGDALLNRAAELTASSLRLCRTPSEVTLAARAMELLFLRSGTGGMLGGQTLDVEAEGRPVSGEELYFIQSGKTAALLEAALMCGALLGGAGEEDLLKLEEAGKNLGLAFQIRDDLLDAFANEEELGKPVHSDERNRKNTYLSLYGEEKARADEESMLTRALLILQSFPGQNPFLEELVKSLGERSF